MEKVLSRSSLVFAIYICILYMYVCIYLCSMNFGTIRTLTHNQRDRGRAYVQKYNKLLSASEVSANLYCNSRTSVLGRLRDYLRLLMGRTLDGFKGGGSQSFKPPPPTANPLPMVFCPSKDPHLTLFCY